MAIWGPAIPFRHEGFGDSDFLQSGTRDRKSGYATDGLAGRRVMDGVAKPQPSERSRTSDDAAACYRTLGRKLPTRVEQFALNWLARSAEMADRESGILQSMNVVVSKDTKKMSQIDEVKLTM